jgi:hypothetical protein
LYFWRKKLSLGLVKLSTREVSMKVGKTDFV